jgi:hypothetical protein
VLTMNKQPSAAALCDALAVRCSIHLSGQLVIDNLVTCMKFLYFKLDIFWTVETLCEQH